MHPDIEMVMLTGYQSSEHMEYERKESCHDPLVKSEYDDSNTLFKTLEEEI